MRYQGVSLAAFAIAAGSVAAGAQPVAVQEPPGQAEGEAFFAPAGKVPRPPRAPLGAAQRLERRFLQVTAANVTLQAEGSHIALARTANPAVRELATALLERDKEMLPELLRLLHVRGMAMPLLANEHRKQLKQMERLKGPRLDRAYVDEIVLRTVEADVPNFEHLATAAEDPVLRAWAERQLPGLRSLLARARATLPAARSGQRAL